MTIDLGATSGAGNPCCASTSSWSPSKRHADLIIPEGGENQVAIDAIIARVERLLA